MRHVVGRVFAAVPVLAYAKPMAGPAVHRNWSVQDAGIPTQLATYHRLEQPGERVGVEEVSVGACSVAIHRYATPGSRDVPGLAAAPLEGHRPQVGLFDVAAEHDHAVVGDRPTLLSPIAGATGPRYGSIDLLNARLNLTPVSVCQSHGLRGTMYAERACKGRI